MSRTIIYRKDIDPLKGIQDGNNTINFTQPIQFQPNSLRYIKILEASIPANLPNICSAYDNNKIIFEWWNNSTMTARKIVMLPDGIYTTESVNAAIQKSLNTQTAIYGDYPLFLKKNTTTQKLYWDHIISKWHPSLNTTSLKIDMSQSEIGKVLGWGKSSISIGSGLFESPNIPQFDYFGNRVYINIDGLGYLSIVNERSSNTLATINLGNVQGNVYTFPMNGELAEPIQLEISDQLSGYSINFVAENGKNIVSFDGVFYVKFVISENI